MRNYLEYTAENEKINQIFFSFFKKYYFVAIITENCFSKNANIF